MTRITGEQDEGLERMAGNVWETITHNPSWPVFSQLIDSADHPWSRPLR